MDIRFIEYKSEDYWKSIELRDKILRKPLGLVFSEEFLAQDEHQFNIGAFDGEKIVGILLLQKLDDKTLKMRQVAVDENLQGKGIGKKMVIFSEKIAIEKGFSKIELNARDTAIPFYKSLKYNTIGDVFIEVGIKHKKMVKHLK